ncbi:MULTISPECIES: alpha/beta hydrolase [unclassified Sphingomonas]|uniref:alpha/beta hydrolase n=1 Tax=unclassified Sphingomonas TaxID=196159 RepID=UPI002151712F|nr:MULTISPECIES: alpha/beta hydrolase [unclassified Sphingomonas]MCR5871918.1 alpha/beta hydrolase [Sphingomonas sp. J344]UUX99803.1 alpha/beta hydrolase [Sphingomonas sp. J315]
MRAIGFGLAMAVLTIPASAQEAAPAVQSKRDIVYRTTTTGPLHLDLHRPQSAKGKRAPVLVVIHGGAWARGERPKGWTGHRRFVEAGFAIISMQYRLSGQAQAPAAVEDVRCVMGWIAERAALEGLDPKRIVLMGTSAGAHLALMGAYIDASEGLDPKECGAVPRAAAVIDFYGPTDLRPESLGAWSSPSIGKWVGEGAAGAAMAARMSPIARVRAGRPPVFIVHGDADPVVPLAASTALKAALDRAKVPAELHIVPGGVHGKFDPVLQDRLLADAVTFLKRHRVID